MTDTNGVEVDLWHVESSSGEVLVVTIEQLDEAFNLGHVNEQTRVWQEGMPVAVSLRELLGLDSEDSAEQRFEEPPPAVEPRYAQAPAPHANAQQAQAPAPSHYPPAAAPSYRPPAAGAASGPSTTSVWPPPVVATSVRPSASVPPPSGPPGSWQMNAVPSVMPTAFDVEDDFVPFARPRSRSGLVFGMVGALALAAGAMAYMNSNADATTAAATVAPAVVAPAQSRALDTGNAPLHLSDVPPAEITKPDAPLAAPATPNVDENLSLREVALRAANAKSKSHAHARAAAAGKGRRHGRSNVAAFKSTKGGSKYDPLNGSL